MENMDCFFGIEVEKNSTKKVTPEIGFLHVSQAALAKPVSGKVSLQVAVEGKTFTLGTLSAGEGIYHMPLDLNFMPGSEVQFSVSGEGSAAVHLTGYYELDDEDEDFPDNLDAADADEEEEESESSCDSSEEEKPAAPVKAVEAKKEEKKAAQPQVTAPSTDEESSCGSDEEEEDEEEEGSEDMSGMDEEDEEIPSDDDESSESEEDDQPQKKGKDNHGKSFSKPQDRKSFQPRGESGHHEKSFHNKDQGRGRSFGGSKFQSRGGFNGGNRFDGNRNFDRNGGNKRGGFNNNRGGGFSRGGNRGGSFNRGGNRGGSRGGFRGRR